MTMVPVLMEGIYSHLFPWLVLCSTSCLLVLIYSVKRVIWVLLLALAVSSSKWATAPLPSHPLCVHAHRLCSPSSPDTAGTEDDIKESLVSKHPPTSAAGAGFLFVYTKMMPLSAHTLNILVSMIIHSSTLCWLLWSCIICLLKSASAISGGRRAETINKIQMDDCCTMFQRLGECPSWHKFAGCPTTSCQK